MGTIETEGKPIECKAAICWSPNTPMTVETITVETPKTGEIRIKMISAGICGSDIALYKGHVETVRYPIILGHEGNAVVESVGEGVVDFKKGDSVFPLWNPECKECSLCKSPYSNICEKFQSFMGGLMLDGTSRYSKDGQIIHAMSALATFSEFSVVHEMCLVKVADNLPLTKLSPFGCCVPTGYGAAVNTVNVHVGSSVAIWGLGAVGLCVALACRNGGAKIIIGIDTNSKKFDKGQEFGCTDFINPSEEKKSTVEIVREMTDGGADFTFVSVGNKQAAEDALDACHKVYGHSVLIGIIGGDGKVQASPLNLLYGKTWKGSYCGGYRAREGIPKLISSYMDGELQEIDSLITSQISIDKINLGFQDLIEGKQIRTVIIY